MNIANKSFSQLSTHKFQRLDTKYWNTTDNIIIKKCVLLQDIFSIISGSVQTLNYVTEITPIPYIRIGDMSYKYGIDLCEAVYLNEDTQISEYKILKSDDIIVATIGATVGKSSLAENAAGGTFSNNTVVLRKKTNKIDPKFYSLLLQTDYYIKYIFGVVSQKAQPNLQDYDLKKIKLPYLEKDTTDKVILKIIQLEDKINALRKNTLSSQQIIDDIFCKKFNFNYEEFNRSKNTKIYNSNFVSFSNNLDLRCSAKFHRKAGDFVMKELCNITTKKIKHYLSEPIVLGASISPSDYSDDGVVYYLSMATIKNWEFSHEDARTVLSQYAEDKKTKTIKKDDILIARSGEGTIGKVALIEDDDIQAVFADFTMRIRLKNYNHKFAYYYFRSTYFQYLVEVYKKGLGNNTNIFPIVIKDFPIPDINLEEQEHMLNQIQIEIDKQNTIKSEIGKLRSQIDEIIEHAITTR